MPPLDWLRLREHVHGPLGWAAALALAHPALLLRAPGRRAHLSVALAVGVVTLAAALGASLYDPYRATLRQPLFASAPTMGTLFERKEHLAFGAVALAWTGAVAYAGAAFGGDGRLRPPLRAAARRAFAFAALFAACAAVIGTVVAAVRSF